MIIRFESPATDLKMSSIAFERKVQKWTKDISKNGTKKGLKCGLKFKFIRRAER